MPQKLRKLHTRFRRFRHILLPRRIRKFKLFSRKPHAVPIFTFGVLLVLTSLGLLLVQHSKTRVVNSDNRIVIISYDHHQQTVPSREATVGRLINKLQIPIHDGDVIEPAKATKIDQDQFRINIYRAVPVQVVDGSQRSLTYSAAVTPRSLAQQAGTTLYPEDRVVTQPAQNFIKTGAIGEEVIIDRATPVNVNLYGTKLVLRTHAKTVAELMKEKNIKLTKDDRLSVPPATLVSTTQPIEFIRTGVKVEAVSEQIAAPIQNISDPSLAYGTSAVRQQGSPGQQVVTYQIQLVNNVETGRTVIQKVVNKQPVTQIVVTGSSLSGIKGDMALAGIAPGDYQYADYIISRESGWCPTKAQGQYGGCPPYSGSVPSYGGYGLCQSTPGSKMATAGADWATNPITQLRWCSNYAKRYGGWAGSYQHWLSNHNW